MRSHLRLDHHPLSAVNRKTMRVLLSIGFISGCGAAVVDEPVAESNPTPVAEAARAADPGPMVDLVQRTASVVGVDPDCPRVMRIDTADDALHERWVGGCQLSDGTEVLGVLERRDAPDGAWVTGTDFRLVQQGELVFALDGAIELTDVDALWLMDIAASVCGIGSWPCSDGMLGMDLTTTMYPSSGFPDDYDTTVSGAIATDRATTTVDGAWSVNSALCAIEPTDGTLSVRHGDLHAIALDGRQACDGCAAWEAQGQPMPSLCGLNR